MRRVVNASIHHMIIQDFPAAVSPGRSPVWHRAAVRALGRGLRSKGHHVLRLPFPVVSSLAQLTFRVCSPGAVIVPTG